MHNLINILLYIDRRNFSEHEICHFHFSKRHILQSCYYNDIARFEICSWAWNNWSPVCIGVHTNRFRIKVQAQNTTGILVCRRE